MKVQPLAGDIVLDKLEGTGLTKKSTIRLFKLANFAASNLRGEIGILPKNKIPEVKRELKKLFQI